MKITFKNSDGSGEEESEVYDTVLVATGRYPDTKSIGCESLGIEVARSGKIVVKDNEQTNIESIFAIGDCTEGRLELTPPAIKAG